MSRIGGGTRAWLMTLLLLAPTASLAHRSSDAYVYVHVTEQGAEARVDLGLRDLQDLVGLDADRDGSLTWGELREARATIEAYVLPRLRLVRDGVDCTWIPDSLATSEHLGLMNAALTLRADCATDGADEPSSWSLNYDLLFELDQQHRGLLRLSVDDQISTAVFAPDRREHRFGGGVAVDSGQAFSQYFGEGLWHVWIGLDHLLFLSAVFLPAVLRRTKSGWKVAADPGEALWPTVALVTSFTLAHAVTLTLSAFGLLSIPSRWIESAVAASVVFAGLNNLYPMVHRRLVGVAAAFGLIHGAAIAGALLDLGLPQGARMIALLGFNLGVEVAQLALVAGLLPLAYAVRRRPTYRRWVFMPASALIVLVGLAWFVQRILDLPPIELA